MSLRLFSALDIPDDVADRVRPLLRGVPGAKWRPRENLHVTLRFYGEISEIAADDLDAALGEVALKHGQFDIRLKGAGFFGREEPHALWLGLEENAALRALAADCDRAARRLKLPPPEHKFSPHMTVAYLSGAALDRVIAFEKRLALYESETWTVDAFFLLSSRVRRNAPSLYAEEASYPLAG
ncbi:MAG: RNA 2',3'-cyclic phosphodiesterase [Hyphomonadaceae bacterium]|nr:RNA 2',3'-cyclic phosphodiesterase [Hyphomonadaceae bacterium]